MLLFRRNPTLIGRMIKSSLTLVSDEDPVPLPGALHPRAVQGVIRLLLQLLKVKKGIGSFHLGLINA